jgi:hypothetical protein
MTVGDVIVLFKGGLNLTNKNTWPRSTDILVRKVINYMTKVVIPHNTDVYRGKIRTCAPANMAMIYMTVK